MAFVLCLAMNLGQRIKSLREEKGLTQKDLATISGVCQQMISKLETGKSQQTSDIVKLACALGVSALWLEGLSSESSSMYVNRTGDQLHHKAVQITIEFLSIDAKKRDKNLSFRKQAELFRQCYELCTRAENKALSKQQIMGRLNKEICIA